MLTLFMKREYKVEDISTWIMKLSIYPVDLKKESNRNSNNKKIQNIIKEKNYFRHKSIFHQGNSLETSLRQNNGMIWG